MRLILLLFMVLASTAQADDQIYTLTRGHVTEDAGECVFDIGQGASVLLHPKSMACVRMRELVKAEKSIQLQVVVE